MRPVGVDWLSSAYPALRPKATQTKGFCGRLSGVSAGRRGRRRIMTINARHACGPTSVVLEFHMSCCRDRRGMSGPVDANGLPSELGPLDTLLHRVRPIRGPARGSWPWKSSTARRLEPVPVRLRERVPEGPAAASEGRRADAAHRGAAVGCRPRLQPRLPRAPGAGARARHAASGTGPGRGQPPVTA